ncbi:hypothetical protein ACIBK8_29845 [Streptomyces sp. NPDC050161]|uniref:hypothetical protein n=1 Tax=Streptomyces sp. NPDC050161 TaxID=3365604 RepID=UPI0037A8536D
MPGAFWRANGAAGASVGERARDESPVGEYLGVAPMGLASWFKLFNGDRYAHPYAVDELAAEERG